MNLRKKNVITHDVNIPRNRFIRSSNKTLYPVIHRFATLIPAVLNLLMPWASGLHYGFVLALRFVMGFFGVSCIKKVTG